MRSLLLVVQSLHVDPALTVPLVYEPLAHIVFIGKILAYSKGLSRVLVHSPAQLLAIISPFGPTIGIFVGAEISFIFFVILRINL